MLNHANDSVTFIHNTNDKICWHTSVCSIAYCWWSVVMCFTVCRRDKRAYRHSYIPLTDASKQLNSLKQPLGFVLSYQKRNSRNAILLVFAGHFSAWLWSSYLYIYIFLFVFCPRSLSSQLWVPSLSVEGNSDFYTRQPTIRAEKQWMGGTFKLRGTIPLSVDNSMKMTLSKDVIIIYSIAKRPCRSAM